MSRGSTAAAAELVPQVYEELRTLARVCLRRDRPGHTLQPTALVHEAFLRLVDGKDLDFKDRTHFLALAARLMRQVLIDHHRKKGAAKRGGEWKRLTLSGVESPSAEPEVDFLELDDALDRLTLLDERQGRIVELRFFGGLSIEEAAGALGVSTTTVEGEWRLARAWLARELGGGG